MVSLFVLSGGLFAVLVISTLLHYYRKYKAETEARFLEIRLLLKSAKEHQNHISKQLLDIMKSNKEDLMDRDTAMEERLNKAILAQGQKFDNTGKVMMDQISILDRKHEQMLNTLKESIDTQLDIIRRGRTNP
jgi:CHASE3 domain sensor protein